MKIFDTEVRFVVMVAVAAALILAVIIILWFTNTLPIFGEGGRAGVDEGETKVQEGGVVGEDEAGIKSGLLEELAGVAGEGASAVASLQDAGSSALVNGVNLPQDGWVVIHEVVSGHVANALGAARRDAGNYEEVVVPLLRNTEPDRDYVVVLYADNGNGAFELRADQPIVKENGDPVIVPFRTRP